MRLVAIAASVSLIVACTSKESKPAEPPPTAPKTAAPAPAAPAAPTPAPPAPAPPTPTPTAGHLVLAAGTLTVDRGGTTKVLALAATGELTADGAVIGKLTTDGVATDAAGKRLAAMAADGTVTIDGESETFTIAADGTATRAGKPLVTIAADGVLGGDAIAEAKPATTITLGGDTAARRALVFAWLIE